MGSGSRRLFVSLVIVVAILGSLLVFQATRSTTSSVLDPAQLAAEPEQQHERIRVAGRVADEEILYRLEPKIVLSFKLSSREKPESPSIPVVYEGIRPDMFQAGRDVLVDGDFRSGTLFARELLTQCPSKYEPPSPQAPKEDEQRRPPSQSSLP